MDVDDDNSSPTTPLLGSQRSQPSAASSELRPRNSNANGNADHDTLRPLNTENDRDAVNQDDNDDDDDDSSNHRYHPRHRSFATQCQWYLRRGLQEVTTVIVDEQGTGWPVVMGLLGLVVMGSIMGAIFPGNSDLPPGWPRYLSNAIGYTYFMAWSISFYPQVVTNWRRKSTTGLSPDFCGLNVIGFGCYMIYNVTMFFSALIHTQYRQRHGPHAAISVQSNDVAFAVHAFCLASITFAQIGYYNKGFGQAHSRPSKLIVVIGAIFLTLALGTPILIVCGISKGYEWLDYLYLLGNIKVCVTLMKYMPQVWLNYQRQSTVGWSIWNILLDFTGGTLSDLQLVLDCAVTHDWTGITGNLVKLALGSISMVFDVIFMAQHYVLYPNYSNGADNTSNTNNTAQQLALLSDPDARYNSEQDDAPMVPIDECNL